MNNLIELGKKHDMDIEIFKEKCKATDVSTLDNKIKLFQITDVTSYIVKAIKNNICIKLVTEDIDNTEKIINSLEEIFTTTDNKNNNKLAKGNIIHKEVIKEKLDLTKVKEDLLSLNNLKEIYPCIKSIETEFTHYEQEKHIVNNLNNCNLYDSLYLNSYGAAITISNEEETRVLYLGYFTKEYNFLEFKNYLEKRLEYLLKKLGSVSIKTGKYKVLLTNNVTENILSTFTSSFQSKGIYLKESVLTDKLNKKIFSDKITIIEDSQKGIASNSFDSEGIIKNKQVIVDKGIFCKEINNLEYALKLSKEPTGNADGVNNLYIEPGNKSFNDLIKLLDNGIIIDEAFGFHCGVDKKTGNISVQAEGFLVKNGKITKGLNMIILSTNFFEVFTNVCEVGNDLSKTSLKVSTPSILLDNISIAGKEKNE